MNAQLALITKMRQDLILLKRKIREIENTIDNLAFEDLKILTILEFDAMSEKEQKEKMIYDN